MDGRNLGDHLLDRLVPSAFNGDETLHLTWGFHKRRRELDRLDCVRIEGVRGSNPLSSTRFRRPGRS